MLEKQLAEISGIPTKLDQLIDKMKLSNSALASQVADTMKQTAKELTGISHCGESTPYSVAHTLPSWMKWTIIVSVILIALACISNTAYNIWYTQNASPQPSSIVEVAEEAFATIDVAAPIDSVSVQQDSLQTDAQGKQHP